MPQLERSIHYIRSCRQDQIDRIKKQVEVEFGYPSFYGGEPQTVIRNVQFYTDGMPTSALTISEGIDGIVEPKAVDPAALAFVRNTLMPQIAGALGDSDKQRTILAVTVPIYHDLSNGPAEGGIIGILKIPRNRTKPYEEGDPVVQVIFERRVFTLSEPQE